MALVSFRRFLTHVAVAGVAGALVGALDGALSAPVRDVSTILSSIWIGVGCVSVIAAPLGAVLALIEVGLRRVVRHQRISETWGRLTNPTQRKFAPLIARAHAGVVLGLFALAFVLALVWRVDAGLVVIQDQVFRRILLTLAVGISIGIATIWVLLLTAPVTRWFARIDRRFGLPWPQSNSGRFVVYIALPALIPSFGMAVALLAKYGSDLTVFTRPIGLFLWLEFVFLIHLLLRASKRLVHKLVIGLALVLGLTTVLSVPFVLGEFEHGRATVAAGAFMRPAVVLLTRATDWDRDEFSSLYLGGDCDPLDATVNVAAPDVPGNGKDENCDGFDTPLDAPILQPSLFSGTLTPARIADYNVLWIVVDAMRPASMDVYGHHRRTTPALTEFSRSALVFENAYAQSTITHLSLPCMLTGKSANRITWVYGGDKSRLEADVKHPTLAERLKPHGYYSTAVASRFIGRLPSILRGFDKTVTDHRRELRYDGPGTTNAAIRALHEHTRRSSDPFFLFLYYEDPHKPYETHGSEFPSFGSAALDRYEGEIAFVDRYLGFLFEHLRLDRALWDKTIVIVTADHGEEFGEHGGFTHGKNCRERSARVPLLVKIPGVEPRRVLRRVSLTDIVPTVLELVGVEAKRDALDGRSLLSALNEFGSMEPSFCTITNQGGTSRGKPFFQRSVRFGSRVLVQDLLSGQVALFDADRDRLEMTNLFGDPSELATARHLKHLLDWDTTGNLFQMRLKD